MLYFWNNEQEKCASEEAFILSLHKEQISGSTERAVFGGISRLVKRAFSEYNIWNALEVEQRHLLK